MGQAQMRLHFSNVFGDRPVTFDGVFVGLHWSGGAVVHGTNRAVHFGGKPASRFRRGRQLERSRRPALREHPAAADSPGRKLAVSFHVAGESGPMTWHAKALTTSYLSRPGAGAKGQTGGRVRIPVHHHLLVFPRRRGRDGAADTRVIVAFGDSITDGTASTLNGDDRWPNALSRRLHAAYGNRVSVVNAGIGGNQVLGPAEYSLREALLRRTVGRQRLERDVIGLSGVSAVIWLEGINDFGANATAEAVEGGMREDCRAPAQGDSRVRVIGATVVSALGNTSGTHGSQQEDVKRRALNEFIRSGGALRWCGRFRPRHSRPRNRPHAPRICSR